MAFARCVKRSTLGFNLYEGLYNYSSSIGRNKCGYYGIATGVESNGLFVRSLSTGEISSLEQRDLIKNLRERTSAPMKDVKAALVARNWDIGEFF